MKKILVTGASGFIGGHIVAALSKGGYKVRCLVRKNSRLDFITQFGPEFYFGDVTDPSTLEKALEGVDGVVHGAGLTKAINVSDYYRVNEDGTRNLFYACRKFNHSLDKIVHLGSLAAIGPSFDNKPVTEESPPNPISDYGRSKLAGQGIAESHTKSLPVTVLILPAVYGPMDKEFLLYFKILKIGLMPFIGCKTRSISLVHASDVAKAVLLCLENKKSKGRAFLLSDNEIHTWQSFADAISRVIGKKPRPIHIPEMAVQTIARVAQSVARIIRRPTILNTQKVNEMLQDSWTCSSKRIRDELGFYNDYTLEQGIKETFEWYKVNRWL